ncbi:ferritin-like domain-containing protein [Tardiphaga sp. vice154]|uniref:ferritin-like domain-containing protein n=1 Tax=Tardiphaga sp. vice154 TaxID=2592814 RepID=UPI001165867B|nr:ferritin-like domain-containing protein [Tardiphaga sp. vice154]QDM24188.1 ferritin-like domain-containing protein [Tardiphaga sp. vice154]
MNPTTILDALDPDLAERLGSKRDLFRKVGAKLGVLATTPVVLAAVSTEAFSQGLPKQIVDILNFALTLEYLEDEFYRTALGSGVVPGQFAEVFSTIGRHESQHVATLTGALGGAAVAKPQFDFTARGKYPDIFRNFATFALVSQTLEDTGVAAYKGQAPALTGGGDLLTTALRIHSVEARHAAEVRRVRGVKSWTGAFDKPMTKSQVLAAAMPFIAG